MAYANICYESANSADDGSHGPMLYGLVNKVDGPKLVGHIYGPVRLVSSGELLYKTVVADENLILVLGKGPATNGYEELSFRAVTVQTYPMFQGISSPRSRISDRPRIT